MWRDAAESGPGDVEVGELAEPELSLEFQVFSVQGRGNPDRGFGFMVVKVNASLAEAKDGSWQRDVWMLLRRRLAL